MTITKQMLTVKNAGSHSMNGFIKSRHASFSHKSLGVYIGALQIAVIREFEDGFEMNVTSRVYKKVDGAIVALLRILNTVD